MKSRVVTIVAYLFFVTTVAFASDCTTISKETPNSKKWNEVKQFIAIHYESKTIDIRQITDKDSWYIVEFESRDFEPVISVLKETSSGLTVKSDWGGMPVDGDSIKDYLAEKTKGVPPDLLWCFSPKGPPFARIKQL